MFSDDLILIVFITIEVLGQFEHLDGAIIPKDLKALIRVSLLHALVDLKYICYVQKNGLIMLK